MEVRYPQIDYSRVKVHWARNPEFAQTYNAFSTVPAHIEPYLVKVMMQAKKVLPVKHEKLHREMDIFIKQEVQHCKQHLAFNKHLADSGYPGMLPIEAEYKADYERFLKKKSLRFNIAYSEGFESMGCAAAQVFFEDIPEYLEGAAPEVVDLWGWHLAEEFEHREVCFQLYKALYGRGPFAYAYRIYGFVVAMRHINAHVARVAKYLIGKDREGMTAEQRQASRDRLSAYQAAVQKASLRRLRQVFSPFYNPAKRTEPVGMAALLARFSTQRGEVPA